MAVTAEDLKKLSPRVKAVLVFFACLLVAYFYYFFYLQSAWEKKGNLESKLSELQQDIAAKQKIAAEKDKYVRELKKLRETFQLALTKLPDKKEIPGLFESVSVAGRNSGIEFLLFEPVFVAPLKDDKKDKGNKERRKAGSDPKDGEPAPSDEKFYTDIPIRVKVLGSFQNTLEFFDKISKLPRIINVENLTLGDRNEGKGGKGKKDMGSEIITTCVIKTYMFLDKGGLEEKGSGDVQTKK
jgi:type IV pilus assembly protein PilO